MNSQQLHLIALTTDPTIRQSLEPAEADDRWRVEVTEDPAGLFSTITPSTQLILIDEADAEGGYTTLIKRARKTHLAVDAFVVGGPKADDVKRAEHDAGVDYYYERPVEGRALRSALAHRMALVALKSNGGIIGRSPGIEELLESVLQVAPTEVLILIEGESGTGKDVIAHAIHWASRRSNQSFEAINCGSLAEGVLESELFGHEKGAFTGATARRAGMFERANGGTIFLDEVGEMSPNMQVRLLRVLESGEVLRVGGVSSFNVNVRVIAATNRKLSEAVANGSFRQDLYYRLKGINLFLPPLRQRPGDIPILVHHFMRMANRQHHKSVRGIDSAALNRLSQYHWPGNIRELKNLVDTLVVLAAGPRITAAEVEAKLADSPGVSGVEAQPLLPVPLHRSKEEAEREMIYASILALHRDVREILSLLGDSAVKPDWGGLREVRPEPPPDAEPLSLAALERTAIHEALDRYRGNRRQAAQLLGISERTLYRKIKEYGLI